MPSPVVHKSPPDRRAEPLERGTSAERRVPRVVVCENCQLGEAPVLSVLKAEGFEPVCCADGKALLEEVVQRRPDVVVYCLRAECDQDLGVLHLFRRIAHDVPLVLVASDDSLSTQKLVQELRPIYYAVRPAEAAELREAVESALERRGRPVA
jgi:DNA-binding NarL/FixJ family response regulator